jgi:N,N'-diacetyllegionaminate synthase
MKIIAEIGSVHNGSLQFAKSLIKHAANSSADIVKFQMHIAEYETLKDAPSPKYFKSEDRYSYFKRTSFNFKQWKIIKSTCDKYGVEFLCSPFSLEAVDLLEKLKVKKYKIPSGEVTNIPLLEKVANTKKPILLSTGMSNFNEIREAYKICKNNDLTIMQCSSIYPCPEKFVGLNILKQLKKKFKCRLGFSDHTLGHASGIIAAYLKVDYIEKHFTTSKKLYGSDAKFSMEPEEFKNFCKEIRNARIISNNSINKNNLRIYKNMKKVFEKSIVAKNFIPKGKKLDFDDISFKKPGSGIKPKFYKKIINYIAKKNINIDEQIKWEKLKKK